MKSHKPASRFVLRTPLLPLEHGKTLEELLADPVVVRAVEWASRELASKIDDWRKERDPGVERALARYVLRMAGRATPRGLLAGVSTGTFGGETKLELGPHDEHVEVLRDDIDQVAQGASSLRDDEDIGTRLRPTLVYRPNTSLYELDGKLRYVEALDEEHGRRYQLVELEVSPELIALVERARGGATLAELAGALDDVDAGEAEAFVDELVAAQVLVDDLVPPLAARDPLAHVNSVLRRAAPVGPGPHSSPQLAVPQVPALHKPARATLGARVVADLERAVELLRAVGRGPDASPFPAFRAAFEARFGTREVPLVEVLEDDAGIGFLNSPTSSALLTAVGIPAMRGEAARIAWGRREERLLQFVTSGKREIELSDDDIEALTRDPLPAMHDTFVLECALVARDDDFDVYARSVGGPALRTIARHAFADPEIEKLASELAGADQANRDAIYAEIIHMPAGADANVAAHPSLYSHAIPYLGTPLVGQQTIPITDLLVSVIGDRVVLRSREHDKEVVPRLCSAYDFTSSGLAIYRFLGALAWQDGTSAQWTWGPLASAPFLPRIRRGRVILARARWNLRVADIAAKRAELPRWVVLVDGERVLPLDLDSAPTAHALDGRDAITLDEMLPLAAYGPEGAYVHELTVPFVRKDPKPVRTAFPVHDAVRRSFPPGSEWFYAKLYTGEASADTLLHDVVAPLVADAKLWFFVRYHDPDPHIRLRIHGQAPPLDKLAGWRVAIDTYEREVERYRAIAVAEEMFCADSIAALALIDQLAQAEDPERERWLATLRAMDRLLDDLGLDLRGKQAHATRARDGYGAELGLTTEQQKRLGVKFRLDEADIAAALASPDDALAARSARLAQLVDTLRKRAIEPAELALSLVHMCVNRRIPTAARATELVLYDFLRRSYARKLNS